MNILVKSSVLHGLVLVFCVHVAAMESFWSSKYYLVSQIANTGLKHLTYDQVKEILQLTDPSYNPSTKMNEDDSDLSQIADLLDSEPNKFFFIIRWINANKNKLPAGIVKEYLCNLLARINTQYIPLDYVKNVMEPLIYVIDPEQAQKILTAAKNSRSSFIVVPARFTISFDDVKKSLLSRVMNPWLVHGFLAECWIRIISIANNEKQFQFWTDFRDPEQTIVNINFSIMVTVEVHYQDMTGQEIWIPCIKDCFIHLNEPHRRRFGSPILEKRKIVIDGNSVDAHIIQKILGDNEAIFRVTIVPAKNLNLIHVIQANLLELEKVIEILRTELVPEFTSEQSVFCFVINWLQHDMNRRLPYLKLLLSHIKFEYMSSSYKKFVVVPVLKHLSTDKETDAFIAELQWNLTIGNQHPPFIPNTKRKGYFRTTHYDTDLLEPGFRSLSLVTRLYGFSAYSFLEKRENGSYYFFIRLFSPLTDLDITLDTLVNVSLTIGTKTLHFNNVLFENSKIALGGELTDPDGQILLLIKQGTLDILTEITFLEDQGSLPRIKESS